MKISTAYPIVRIKIERNNALINLFELKSKVLKLEMILRLRHLQQNDQYIKLINDINVIERRQLYEYTLDRENEVKRITNLINTVEVNIKDLEKDLLDCAMKGVEIVGKIDRLSRSIPDVIYVNNLDDDEPLLEHQKSCGYRS